MLLLAFSIIFFVLIYQKRLSDQQSRIRTLELDYQKELTQSILRAQEFERKRIATDLHDSLGSTLSAIKLYLNQLTLDCEPSYYTGIKKESAMLLDNTIANIRRITRNLLPASLERFGMVHALEDLCKRMNDLGVFQVQYYYNQDKRFDKDFEMAVYRIVQELLNNTYKHANARKVSLEIKVEQSFLALEYEDDGEGFDLPHWQEAVKSSNGIGLGSIETRVNLLNAQMYFFSQKGKGVKVQLDIPTIKA